MDRGVSGPRAIAGSSGRVAGAFVLGLWLAGASTPVAANTVYNRDCINTTFGGATNHVNQSIKWTNCTQRADATTETFLDPSPHGLLPGAIEIRGVNTNLGSLVINNNLSFNVNYGVLFNSGLFLIGPNGSFTNWAGGIISALPGSAFVNAGRFDNGVNYSTRQYYQNFSTASVIGTAELVFDNNGTFNNYQQMITTKLRNFGAFNVVGGSLTSTTLDNYGSLAVSVDGWTAWDGTLVPVTYGQVNVAASLTNFGNVTVKDGTSIVADQYVQRAGTTTIEAASATTSTRSNGLLSARIIQLQGGTLAGRGTIRGALTVGAGAKIALGTVVQPAALLASFAPEEVGMMGMEQAGASELGPSSLVIEGSLTVEGGEILFSIDPAHGLTKLTVLGPITFHGGVVRIDLTDVDPTTYDLDLFDATELAGFESVQLLVDGLAPGLTAKLAPDGTIALTSAVTAPGSAMLLLAAGLGLATQRRRLRRRRKNP